MFRANYGLRFCVLQGFRPFYPCFDPNSVCFDSPQMSLSHHSYGEERRAREFGDTANHGPSMMKAKVRGELETTCLFVFLHLMAEDGRVYA